MELKVVDISKTEKEKEADADLSKSDYFSRYGRSTASSQYFLQLAGYLGIPVIAWNADNAGLEKVEITLVECDQSLRVSRGPLSTPA